MRYTNRRLLYLLTLRPHTVARLGTNRARRRSTLLVCVGRR